MVSNEPLAYPIPEACQVLGIGRSRLYTEIRAGRLRTVKVGSRTLIRRQDAEAWLEHLANEAEVSS